MRRLNLMLAVSTALTMLVACHSDPPPHQAPAPTSEARTESRSAPEPAAAPREEPATESPGVSIELTLGGFNARAFSDFAACSGAALTLVGDRARCHSNCECVGVHHGHGSQEQCMLSCSVD